jgi:hypothetical protein
MSKELYQKMAKQTAEKFGLPVPMFMALVDHESGWNPKAISSAGARGLGQVMPANLQRLGIDQAAYDKDPALQLNQAAFFYKDAIRQAKGDPILGLAYYNASPKAVNRFLDGKSGLPTETANYVPTVLWGSQKFGGQPLPNGAMEDVKNRFGSRIAMKTLVSKTGQPVNPASFYHDPSKDPGLDGVPMADASAPAPPPTAVAALPAPTPVPIELAPTSAPTELAPTATVVAMDNTSLADPGQLVTGKFDIGAALGLPTEQPKHGYPSWFGKMIENEVATA